MKRLFITLGLTLLLVLAYYGSAHADVRSRQSQPTQRNGKGNPKAKAPDSKPVTTESAKVIPSDLDEKTDADKTPVKTSPEAKKDDKGNPLVKARQLENGGTVTSTIVTDDKGKRVIKSKLDGCNRCVAEGEIENFDANKLEDFVDIFVSKEFGKIAAKKDETAEEKRERLKAESKAKAELKKNKEDAKLCLVDGDTFEVFTPAERVTCLENKIDALLEKPTSTSLAEAQKLLDILGEQAAKDIANGNLQSPYAKSIQRITAQGKPDGSNIGDMAKYNTALAVNAFASKAIYLNQYNKVTEMEQAISNTRQQFTSAPDAQTRNRLVSQAAAMTQQVNSLKQNMEQNKAKAQSDIAKFKASEATATGFNKEEIASRYASRATNGSSFYTDILTAADPLMGSPIKKTGNTAADSAGGNDKYAIDYNKNLQDLEKEIGRDWNTFGCRQFGSKFDASCKGSPDNIPSRPLFNSSVNNAGTTGSTAFPPSGNNRVNYNATNNGGRG